MGFPKLPMQWSENGYEIVEKLGEGSYGAVYKLVKNKGTDQEEFSALKIVNWTLGKVVNQILLICLYMIDARNHARNQGW